MKTFVKLLAVAGVGLGHLACGVSTQEELRGDMFDEGPGAVESELRLVKPSRNLFKRVTDTVPAGKREYHNFKVARLSDTDVGFGHFRGDIQLPGSSKTIPSRGGLDTFLFRTNGAKSGGWGVQLGGQGDDVATSVHVSGSVIAVSGTFENRIQLDQIGGAPTVLTAQDPGFNVYVAVYNASGALLFARLLSTDADALGMGMWTGGARVSVSADGSVYAAVNLEEIYTLKLDGSLLLSPQSSQSLAVLKFGPGGSLDWFRQVQGQGWTLQLGNIRPQGNGALLSGTLSGSFAFPDGNEVYQPSSSGFVWQLTSSGVSAVSVLGAELNPTTQLYGRVQLADVVSLPTGGFAAVGALAGKISYTAAGSNHSVVGGDLSIPTTDIIVARFGANGLPLFISKVGGIGTERAASVDVYGNGDLLVAGSGDREFTLPLATGKTQMLVASVKGNTFFARLAANGKARWAHQQICDDEQVLYGAQAVGNNGVLLSGDFAGVVTGAGSAFSSPGKITGYLAGYGL